jgi:acyl dehydratase
MAVRGVYSEAEKRMLEAEGQRFEGMVGWYRPSRDLVATAESIRRLGQGVDCRNPLWQDEAYARGTRWGTILAYPTYQAFFGESGIMSLRAPAECGQQYMIWMGEDWDFYQPVRPGDTFRVWQRRPEIYDVTPLDGTGPRTYGLLEGDLDHINQDDRLVSTVKNFVQRTFRFDRPPSHAMPEYSYTRDELEYIGRLMNEEEIRGRNVRYWEDVQIGEETRPIVTGPTTIATNSLTSAIAPDIGFFLDNRPFFLDSLRDELGPEFILDPATGRYAIRGGPAGRHWSDLAAQAEGEPCAWLFGVVSRFSLLRVLTNWMGDDGFLRRFNWRHMTRTRAGDTLVGRARVVGKRIEKGEHLVDLDVWLRNLRGNVSEAAVATVRLCSREGREWNSR